MKKQMPLEILQLSTINSICTKTLCFKSQQTNVTKARIITVNKDLIIRYHANIKKESCKTGRFFDVSYWFR